MYKELIIWKKRKENEKEVVDLEKNTPIIKINDNGSIRVTGDVHLIDGEGNKFDVKSTFSLCRCGQSKNKPFCDGTHKGIEFISAPRANS